MGSPYVGEIRMFAGTFAPLNWHFCDGALIAISENTPLYQLLGTTYGGDGIQTFALPNLLSRVPIHHGTDKQGNVYVIGQMAGSENVTLNSNQIPQHNHLMLSSTTSPQASPTNNLPGVATDPSSPATRTNVYGAPAGHPTHLNPASIQNDGQSLPHNNLQPYLAINYIISLYGIYPTQS